MASEGLSPVVKQFLREQIHSVTALEILALVRGARERHWSAREINDTLRSEQDAVCARLAELVRSGILAETGGAEAAFHYAPREAALDEAAGEAIRAYQQRPVLVIETIFKPDAGAAQSFSDAFRLRPRQS